MTWSKTPPPAEDVRARAETAGEAWAWWRLDQWNKPEPRRLLPARPGIGDPGVYLSVTYGAGAVSWCGEFGGWCATPDEVSARDEEIARLTRERDACERAAGEWQGRAIKSAAEVERLTAEIATLRALLAAAAPVLAAARAQETNHRAVGIGVCHCGVCEASARPRRGTPVNPSHSARAHLAALDEHLARAGGAIRAGEVAEAVEQIASARVLAGAVRDDVTEIDAHHLAALDALWARVDAAEAIEARDEADAAVERRAVGAAFFDCGADQVQANDPTEGADA